MVNPSTSAPGVGYPHDPPLECDIVMKGGITSGVLYPHAVCELARTYRLRSIGGSSAGAIAAAAAAAAEIGRRSGGFDELEKMVDHLADPSGDGGTVLEGLFQPEASTAPLFRILRSATAAGRGNPRWRILGTILWVYRARVAVCAILAVVATVTGLLASSAHLVAASIGGAVAALIVTAVVLVWSLVRALKKVPENGYGLCSGMPGGRGEAHALTPWLDEQFQTLAGLHDPSAPPVTFGTLGAGGVTLQLMTTNLTCRQPISMPWCESGYYFDPERWRQLFPEHVVRWMEEHPPRPVGSPEEQWKTEVRRRQALPLRPLPDPGDLPVLVAVRMSLSFPLLISAIPLHAVDYSAPSAVRYSAQLAAWRREHPGGTVDEAVAHLEPPEFEVNWFSDGGICVNLPLHFFDSALPRRPTFAINLSLFPLGRFRREDEALNSYLPGVDAAGSANAAGRMRRWSRWGTSGFGALGGFGGAILAAARSWVDEAQLVMPGYRDRVVTIFHTKDEGGMNLDMDPALLTALGQRGQMGAAKLVSSFAGPRPGETPAWGWENHRWIRLRTATCGVGEWFDSFAVAYDAEMPWQTPYSGMLAPDVSPPSYPIPASSRPLAGTRVDELADLARTWAAQGTRLFCTDGPQPAPKLRLVPYDRAPAFGSDLAPDAGDTPVVERSGTLS
ncbi:hypothetical protein G4H71_19175 [Rhodococcus triatomae]|uniref:Patatin-like phospholipase n=1 Tax=Rhodococcus triatomae TaxID=300028 RepID=A0A1G8Q278_9NOCA|nr:patatin-like phospholipase family protein [Rhodococcus triatomae]QNG19203.1 hypothetical protein G4H72_11205 [Rhodococcus triatomae]QNG24886.1 hypothetical protein G4H71_19175 [Rhodococcus triatomae]SDI98803.1 Patatin-like phospholipase [Rhodococcus triatomae]